MKKEQGKKETILKRLTEKREENKAKETKKIYVCTASV